MERLAILGALHEEIADLLAVMVPGATIHRIAMLDFHVGTLWGTPASSHSAVSARWRRLRRRLSSSGSSRCRR